MKLSSADRKNIDPLAPGLDSSNRSSFDNDIYDENEADMKLRQIQKGDDNHFITPCIIYVFVSIYTNSDCRDWGMSIIRFLTRKSLGNIPNKSLKYLEKKEKLY